MYRENLEAIKGFMEVNPDTAAEELAGIVVEEITEKE
jgi:hypothetical protein